MKRKVVNPNIEEKKHQQAIEREQNKDLKDELEAERSVYPKKISKTRPKTGHK
ncbi:MAG: hypothetical protein K1060chlam2_00680 [Chlamydiae bacterium]|nr:hypothetical protein [Chlamydiota bacterium]